MEKRGLTQEWLKVIACLTMLVDHVGAVLMPQYLWLRVIGRIAFPIYCFLLAEGVFLTKDPVRYGFRLGISMLLAELPFDLALFGGVTLYHQSVMVTLLLGFLMGVAMRQARSSAIRILLVIPFALAADMFCSDYGGFGVALVGLFVLTREMENKLTFQVLIMGVIYYLMDSYRMDFGFIQIPIEMFALASVIPICLYSGGKGTKSKAVQWIFYLFYPVHLVLLFVIERFML